MSAQALEAILARAMGDRAFADLSYSGPAQALPGHDLTPEEAAAFKDLAREDLSIMAGGTLEERKSFGWANHNEGELRFS